jgi:hypothetical protein
VLPYHLIPYNDHAPLYFSGRPEYLSNEMSQNHSFIDADLHDDGRHLNCELFCKDQHHDFPSNYIDYELGVAKEEMHEIPVVVASSD